uniref:Gfo/Idh/MocA family protein n=1 Tax=Flavobacterium sp. TaxID=239 RepID=UPI0040498FBD
MNNKIKWGIIGLGKIANKFAADLQLSDNAVLFAVASRNAEKAENFSQKYNATKFYDSYEALAEDSEIDVIYIATPNTFHFQNTMMCLQNGKGVLCEKPMGINATEVATMMYEAKSRNLFLMEGIWTRFMPATNKLLEILANKTIGEILFIRADFGFKADPNPDGRLYNKKLGGGSLIDIGIYPLYLSLLTLGIPVDIKAMARIIETGVDSYCAILLDYENGAKASFESTFEANTPTEAYIYGTKGAIKLHSRFSSCPENNHHAKRRKASFRHFIPRKWLHPRNRRSEQLSAQPRN